MGRRAGSGHGLSGKKSTGDCGQKGTGSRCPKQGRWWLGRRHYGDGTSSCGRLRAQEPALPAAPRPREAERAHSWGSLHPPRAKAGAMVPGHAGSRWDTTPAAWWVVLTQNGVGGVTS